MIKKLKVSNYALIDSLVMSPDDSFSILTGETGAGKSIILGALGLVMGERAELAAIKDKAQKCVIELYLDIASYDLEGFFEQNDLEYDPNTIIRREIYPNGKSRAFVNDSPALLSSLSDLAGHLVDIHSQHQTFNISQAEYRVRTLDTFASDLVSLTLYKGSLSKYKNLTTQLDVIKRSRTQLIKEDDYHRFLLSELVQAKLKPGLQDELELLQYQLSNAEKIKQSLGFSTDLLNQDEGGIISQLSALRSAVSAIDKSLPQDADLSQRLENTYIELKDISYELSLLSQNVSDDPTLLQDLDTQLDTIYTLQRKHQVKTIEELLDIKISLEAKVSDLESIDLQIETISKQIDASLEELQKYSSELHNIRCVAAKELSCEIETTIRLLGMPSAKFEIKVEHTQDFYEHGADKISFLFTANKGPELAPVEKTASGGELSRIMLALKCALSKKSKLPTIIFDEIDAGVSGDIADRMGLIMQQMSTYMQVISITHLGQVASRGRSHFKVYKVDNEHSSSSQIALLSPEERVNEIAGMISGANISQSAIDHARELLKVNA